MRSRRRRMSLWTRRSLVLALGALSPLILLEAFVGLIPSVAPRDLQAIRANLALKRVSLPDDELGYVLDPSFRQAFRWTGFQRVYQHAPLPGQPRIGYRMDSRHTAGSPVDIVALGDSFTQGTEMDQDSTWVSRLGRMGKFRVANLGTWGYGTRQEVLLYTRYGYRLRPRWVVQLVVPNDPMDNYLFETWKEGRRRGDPGGSLSDYGAFHFCKSFSLPGPACRAVGAGMRAGVFSYLALSQLLYRYGRSAHEGQPFERGMELLYEDLEALARSTRSHGARLAVILHPGWRPLYPEASAQLAKFLKARGIATLDLHSAVQGRYSGVRMQLFLDAHWNETGHALVAAEIHRFLRCAQGPALQARGGLARNPR